MSRPNEDDVREFVRENKDLLARILAYGDTEGQGYALTALANGGSKNDIDDIQRRLEELKTDAER